MAEYLVSKEPDFPYHPQCYKDTLIGMLSAIEHGTHVVITDPEAITQKLDIKNKSLNYTGPAAFPYESLCLWFTPKILDASTRETVRAEHFLCAQRINNKAIYINYAICDEKKAVDHTGGEMDFSWYVLPFGALFTLPPDTIDDTPILPLRGTLSINTRLRKRVVEIKTGQAQDSALTFISLFRNGSEKPENDNLAYLIPGICQVFFGFLGHLMKKDLKQNIGVEEGFVINDPEGGPPETFSEITYQNVSLK
jgi:hypothetical protein